jgi:hypothetical protein
MAYLPHVERDRLTDEFSGAGRFVAGVRCNDLLALILEINFFFHYSKNCSIRTYLHLCVQTIPRPLKYADLFII